MSKKEVDAWQLAKDLLNRRRMGEMSMGLFQRGTLVSFCCQGEAKIGVITSTEPKVDASGEVFINARVTHMDDPKRTTDVRREREMCVIFKNVFERHEEFMEKLKADEKKAQEEAEAKEEEAQKLESSVNEVPEESNV